MDMKEVWELLRMVSKHAQADVASSSSGSTCTTPLIDLKQISDHVYEISNPGSGRRPSLELIFFHGLQLEGSQQPHLDTWLSRDGSQFWPLWILDHVPEARILTISYDAYEKRGDKSGRTDVYVTNENLLYDLVTESQVGQKGCPVVLVGHCVGGLVMKQLCVHAKSKLDPSTSSTRETPVRNFLENIKGLFFYATPHLGTQLADIDTPYIKGPLFQDVTTLNTEVARRNEEFRVLCKNFGWKTFGIGESTPMMRGKFQGLLVPEASARNNMDNFYTTIEANHTNVCKPESTISFSFMVLISFLQDTEKQAVVPIHECHGLPEYPMELEIRARDVQKKLGDGASLGICGMGGIGKTTLAKKVFNIISKDFEYTCFLDNVKGKDVGTLEGTILGQFQHKGMRPQQTLSQWSQLKGKSTLLVMDDVDAEEQLRILPLGYFKEGSRLIMTSRNSEVFKFYGSCIVYQVDFLQNDAAEELFCKHAFGRDPIPEYLREHVKDIVRKCDGLPLTLEVMGRYLRGRTSKVGVWKETLNRLENATPIHGNDRVWHVLKVSYDGLDKKEQELFLEAAVIFFEAPVDLALTVWGNAEITWENLVSKSLVKEITKTRYNEYHDEDDEFKEVWIHEQLRDLAKSIAGNDMEWRGDGLDVNPILKRLNTDEMKTMTKSLDLSGPRRWSCEELPRPSLRLDSLLRLEHLKCLTVTRVDIEGRGKSLISRLPWTLVPHNLCPHNATVGCSLGCDMFLEEASEKLWFSPIKMGNLVMLRLLHCEVPKELVEALGNFASLRYLCLWKLEGFERLPENFGNLSQLRKLVLEALHLFVLPESFGNLRSLEHLSLSGMSFLELPESFGDLSSLLTLDIRNCPRLVSLPDSFGRDLTSLKELVISGCAIERLPRNFSKLAGLEKVRIDKCEMLEELGDSFGDLVSLQTLTLENVGVRRLPANFGDLSSLQKCILYECSELKSLSHDFSQLTALKKLQIRRCDALETLPENFGRLSSLEDCLLGCPALKGLSDDFGQLTALKELTIYCNALETLPENFGRLSSLEICRMECPALKSLSDDFGHLTALKELQIIWSALDTLPENIVSLKSLEVLRLQWLRELKRLPDNLGLMISLREVQLKYCKKLETLPENIVSLKSLEVLSLQGLYELKRLPDNLGLMISLREVRLEYCKKLESVPDSLGKPCSSQSRLQPGRESDDLMRRGGESPQTTFTNGVRLFVQGCPYLSDSVLGSLSWGYVEADYRDPKCYKRHAQVVHNDVKCDGCEMFPLEGPRYKSTTRFDYDLCHRCFENISSDASDYTCLVCPVIPPLSAVRRV